MRVPSLVWAILVFIAFTLFFELGVAPVTEFLTGTAAPIPASLARVYEALVVIAIVLYFSVREDSWRSFIQPITDFLLDPRPSPNKRRARVALLIALPLFTGWQVFLRSVSEVEAPTDPPGVHFNLPLEYAQMSNPFPWTEENIEEGGFLFMRNCAMCHSPALDGDGMFARAIQPRAADFRDQGSIVQLDENYLFWRIKEGAPALPRGSIRYRSVMPVFEGMLSDEEIWKIIMFEYTASGVSPAVRD